MLTLTDSDHKMLELEAAMLEVVDRGEYPNWRRAMWGDETPSNRWVECSRCGRWSSAADVEEPCFNARHQPELHARLKPDVF